MSLAGPAGSPEPGQELERLARSLSRARGGEEASTSGSAFVRVGSSSSAVLAGASGADAGIEEAAPPGFVGGGDEGVLRPVVGSCEPQSPLSHASASAFTELHECERARVPVVERRAFEVLGSNSFRDEHSLPRRVFAEGESHRLASLLRSASTNEVRMRFVVVSSPDPPESSAPLHSVLVS